MNKSTRYGIYHRKKDSISSGVLMESYQTMQKAQEALPHWEQRLDDPLFGHARGGVGEVWELYIRAIPKPARVKD